MTDQEMTWGQIKAKAEALGISDETKVVFRPCLMDYVYDIGEPYAGKVTEASIKQRSFDAAPVFYLEDM
jgi:hypothetical protein